MKILQIAPPWVDTPPQDYGGTEWVVANLVTGLVDLGHDVTLFATEKSQTAAGLKFVFKKSLLEQNIPWNAALPALIHYHEAFREAGKFDVVHAHLSSETDLAVLPFLADLSLKDIPSLVTFHAPWPFDPYSKMDQMFLTLYADKILSVNISAFMQKILPRQFRDGGFVYNCLDLSKMQFNSKGGSYLTWIGKIRPEKGTAEAIRIAKAAGEQLVFAGVVDLYLKGSKEYFETEVKPLIDGKQIKYLGPADLKLKNKLLGGAKAFLNPINWDEPFGMVMVESMACGTPVISFNRGAAPEVIKDQQTGFLVDTPSQMIKALKRVKQIDRAACREHVEKHFSTRSAAQEYLKLYQKEIRLHRRLAAHKLVWPSVKPDQIFIEQYRHNGSNGHPINGQSFRKRSILSPISG